jgi:hypothetical protein
MRSTVYDSVNRKIKNENSKEPYIHEEGVGNKKKRGGST